MSSVGASFQKFMSPEDIKYQYASANIYADAVANVKALNQLLSIKVHVAAETVGIILWASLVWSRRVHTSWC